MSDWISAETEPKEDDFRRILGMHVKICKGIHSRQGGPPYLYVDCHAGPGCLEYEGRGFLGSPLIFQDIATRENLNYEAVHFERDAETAAKLAEALYVPTSLVDCPDPGTSPIHVESCEEGLPKWLAEHGRSSRRYGLVYSDSINKEIPYAMLNEAASFLSHVDLLAYVGANAYKRRRGANANRARLVEHINAVGKRHVLIRRGRTAHQWTFVLWTNWSDFPQLERIGLYRLESEQGQRILDELNLTRPEHFEKNNQSLPFEDSA